MSPIVLPVGPWKGQQVHTNETMTILREGYLIYMDILRIYPFFKHEIIVTMSPQFIVELSSKFGAECNILHNLK